MVTRSLTQGQPLISPIWRPGDQHMHRRPLYAYTKSLQKKQQLIKKPGQKQRDANLWFCISNIVHINILSEKAIPRQLYLPLSFTHKANFVTHICKMIVIQQLNLPIHPLLQTEAFKREERLSRVLYPLWILLYIETYIFLAYLMFKRATFEIGLYWCN